MVKYMPLALIFVSVIAIGLGINNLQHKNKAEVIAQKSENESSINHSDEVLLNREIDRLTMENNKNIDELNRLAMENMSLQNDLQYLKDQEQLRSPHYQDPEVVGMVEELDALDEYNREPGVNNEAFTEFTNELDTILEAEQLNKELSDSMQISVENHYKDFDRVALTSSKCTDSICRLEIDIPQDPSGLEDVVNEIQNIEVITGAVFYQVDANLNPPVATVYITNE